MPLFKLTVEKNQLSRQIAWLAKLKPTILDPRVMDAGVKYIGAEMANNFAAEGAHAGRKWAELSPTTQRVRKRRGYHPTHPILVQSGQLKDMTAGMMRAWKSGQGAVVRTDGQGTAILAYTAPLLFSSRILGPKVENHWGGTFIMDKRRGGREARLPQRRFFGITSVAAEKASQAIIDKIMVEWGKKSTLTKRV